MERANEEALGRVSGIIEDLEVRVKHQHNLLNRYKDQIRDLQNKLEGVELSRDTFYKDANYYKEMADKSLVRIEELDRELSKAKESNDSPAKVLLLKNTIDLLGRANTKLREDLEDEERKRGDAINELQKKRKECEDLREEVSHLNWALSRRNGNAG